MSGNTDLIELQKIKMLVSGGWEQLRGRACPGSPNEVGKRTQASRSLISSPLLNCSKISKPGDPTQTTWPLPSPAHPPPETPTSLCLLIPGRQHGHCLDTTSSMELSSTCRKSYQLNEDECIL